MAPRGAFRGRKHILVKALPTAAFLEHVGFDVQEIVRERGDTRGGNTQFVAAGPGGIVYKSRKEIRALLLQVGLPWFHPKIDGTKPAMIANYEKSVPEEARPQDGKPPPAKDCIDALLPSEESEDVEDSGNDVEGGSEESSGVEASEESEVAASEDLEVAASEDLEVAASEELEKYKGEVRELQNTVVKLQRAYDEQCQVLQAEQADKEYQLSERIKSEQRCMDNKKDIKLYLANLFSLGAFATGQERAYRKVLLWAEARGYREDKSDIE